MDGGGMMSGPGIVPGMFHSQMMNPFTGMGVPAPGVYVDPFLRRQKIEDMAPEEFLSIPIGDLTQTGELIAGPAAKRDVAASILGVALPKLDRRDQEDIGRAKKYAMEQSIKYVLMKQTVAHQQHQAKSLQRHQALVLMCRVYIGSISFELREDTIRQAFAPFGPIKTINMSWDPVAQKHKGFAFVEYDLPEAAQLALEQMNGVMIGGRNIKCGRDTRIKFSHMDQVIDDLMEEAKVYHRIYVASIHSDLSEEDIKSVFEAFGKIKTCKLAPGPTPGKHRGYGFIEYELSQSAAEAIQSMNLFDLGGQYLRVGKAITPPNALQQANPGQSTMPTAAAVAAAAATAKIQAMEAVTNTAAAFGLSKDTTSPRIAAGLESTSPRAGFVLAPLSGVVPKIATPPQLATSVSLGGFGLGSGLGGLASAPVVAAALPPPGVVQITGLGMVPTVTPVQQPVSVPVPIQHPYATSSPHGSGVFGFSSGPVASIPPPTIMPLMSIPVSMPVSEPTQQLDFQMSSSSSIPSWGQQRSAEPVPKPTFSVEEPAMVVEENENNISLSSQENVSIKGQSARHLVMQKLMRNESSPVIVLKNMVAPEDVDETLKDEITDECNGYGTVERVIIYQEKQSEEDHAPVVVKIFVEFLNPSEAEAAKAALNGRYFGGRRVICEIYEFAMYKHNDLSG